MKSAIQKMTINSTHDIAWIRPEEETRRLVEAEGKKYSPGRISGTEKNLLRRSLFIKIK